MSNFIKKEPVVFQASIQAVLTILMVVLLYSFVLSPRQAGALLIVSGAVLAFWTRRQVTSRPNLPKPVGDVASREIESSGTIML